MQDEPDGRRTAGGHLRNLAEILGTGTIALAVYLLAPLDGRSAEVAAFLVVVLATVSLLPLSIRRARQVLASDTPMLLAMQSIFTALTILIVSFASAYYVLGNEADSQFDEIESKIDALYFTVTVISTVGFGDIVPVGQGARALVTANVLLNLVLVGVSVRVLSWAMTERSGARLREDHPDPPAAGA